MASEIVPDTRQFNGSDFHGGFFASRRGRILKENLTAYLFLTPGLLIIFLFGMFPILYAGYVSLYNWRIRQGEYRGLQNFMTAMGDVGYIFFALLILGLIGAGVMTIWGARTKAVEKNIPLSFPFIYLLPAGLIAFGLAQLILSFITFFTQEQAIAAGHAVKLGNIPLGLAAIIAGFVVNALVEQWQHKLYAPTLYSILPNFITPALVALLTIGSAFALSWFVWGYYNSLDSAPASVAAIRVRFLGQGLLALIGAYFLWSWGMKQQSTIKLFASVAGAAGLMGAAYYLIDVWPAVSAGADPRFYLSLKVTVFYSIGTVPVQLAIAMVLAYLLFQNIHGKGFFRVVFFIPYIAPAVAAAGIFQALFSLRPNGFVNSFFTNNGANPERALLWLKEPGSALAILGQAFGLEAASNWTFGPSLALLVIILFNIWNFVGYNTVIFLAGLGNIPNSLYEAAEIDGAGRWSLFRHITIPLLSPTTFFLSVISVIGTFKAFNHVWVLRDVASLGTTDTVSVYFFSTFFRGGRFGYATAMAMVLFVIILMLTLVQNRIAAKKVFYG
jgi:ABC-type sugar transport system permease subunit